MYSDLGFLHVYPDLHINTGLFDKGFYLYVHVHSFHVITGITPDWLKEIWNALLCGDRSNAFPHLLLKQIHWSEFKTLPNKFNL